MISSLLQFIQDSPVAFHAIENTVKRLQKEGYQEWKGTASIGGKYYVVKNGASLAAFRIPKKTNGYVIAASHSDSPCLRIRDHAEMAGEYIRLSCERYGGLINATWFDRPLSIAGRVMVRKGNKIESKLVDLKKDAAVIPNVAIHFNRSMNEGLSYDPATDMVALFAMGENKGSFAASIAENVGCQPEEILSSDLYLYNNQKGTVWGPKSEFVSSPRLDDLACAFANTESFLRAKEKSMIPVLWISDHEEIGSATKQGAGSVWFPELLEEISQSLNADHRALLTNSFMISCDNAHARHPNHPELSDKNEAPTMNGGVAIKHSPKYATDSIASAVFQEICRKAEVKVQHFSNRPDKVGGGTLGVIAGTKLPVCAVDIGIPQLAMHSSFETMGAEDVEPFCQAIQACYESDFRFDNDSVIID